LRFGSSEAEAKRKSVNPNRSAQISKMRKCYLGDSYDIVKQSMIRWLSSFGEWSVHPMFTEEVLPADAAAFEALLGARLLTAAVLSADTDRSDYLACASSCGNLFIDPDTGLRMQPLRGPRGPEYLFAAELLRLTEPRPNSLTLVFDQSVGRGRERLHLDGKARALRNDGVYAFAYVSHACFLVAARDRSLVELARTRVLEESKLPESRFLPVPAA